MNTTQTAVAAEPAAFVAPGPGSWQQDSVHTPNGVTPLTAELYPAAAMRGWAETFARYGLLLDNLTWEIVNGFVYHQPVPFDAAGPEGSPTPEALAAEVMRRNDVAASAFREKVWNSVLEEWDGHIKPAVVERHVELGGVDLAALSDDDLAGHVRTCVAWLEEMAYLHHRFVSSALAPVADFVLHVAEWLGQDPAELFRVFDGYSPASGVVPPEMEDAVAALRADDDHRRLLGSDADAAAVVAALRAAVPGVDHFVRSLGFRIVDGLDLANPTIVECPDIVVGRLRAGLQVDAGEARRRADVFADSLRARLPEERLSQFDEMLADGRRLYRLRDERALYSDISAFGLLRLALLELGRRCAASGRLGEASHALELDKAALDALLDGAVDPDAEEVAARAHRRAAQVAAGAPRLLGPPPPPPPALDDLPAPLARAMRAILFAVEGSLGQLERAEGDADTIRGISGNRGVYEGRVVVVSTIEDAFDLEPGDVLVARTTGEAFNSMVHLLGAIVTDHGGFASHAAIVARECGFPAVVGSVDATERLHTGQRVVVDGDLGEVRIVR